MGTNEPIFNCGSAALEANGKREVSERAKEIAVRLLIKDLMVGGYEGLKIIVDVVQKPLRATPHDRIG